MDFKDGNHLENVHSIILNVLSILNLVRVLFVLVDKTRRCCYAMLSCQGSRRLDVDGFSYLKDEKYVACN